MRERSWNGVTVNLVRRSSVLLVLMMAASTLAIGLRLGQNATPDRLHLDMEVEIPRQFGDWTEVVSPTTVLISPETRAELATIYTATLSRTYVNRTGEQMMVVLAYGSRQTTRLKAHRQEVCYAAQGFQVDSIEPAVLRIGGRLISATRLIARGANRIEPITYWFTMGDRVVSGHVERLWTQLRFAMTGEIPDGFLVRVSSLSPDTDSAFAKQHNFLAELLAATPKQLAAKLSGDDELIPDKQAPASSSRIH
jgi:EpsI family protein